MIFKQEKSIKQEELQTRRASNKKRFKQEEIQRRRTSNKKRLKQESKHETENKNTCVSIFCIALPKAKSDVVYNMNAPELKVKSDNIWFTLPTVEKSKAILVN